MSRSIRSSVERQCKTLALGTLATATLAGLCLAQGPVISDPDTALQTDEDIIAYWTPERMASAIPREMPQTSNSGQTVRRSAVDEQARRGIVPGWNPRSGLPMPDPDSVYWLDEGGVEGLEAPALSPQAFGTAPTDPIAGPYAPFQRWTWYGRYLTYPTSVIGKLFFTDGFYNYVCSGTVIGTDAVATAGHCVAAGGLSTFYSGFVFCPSYNADGVNPTSGCWAASTAVTSSPWFASGDIDYDYACLVTGSTGTVVNSSIGTFTGVAGRAFNFDAQQLIHSWGYPAAFPFPGFHIIVSTSPEWYEVDIGLAGGQVSKYMGNDMTGGSSGGPWWLDTRHQADEYADTDGSDLTDPLSGVAGGPFINGLNSHKRCTITCNYPPAAFNGVFWQEMGSPPFRSTGADPDDSEDIFQACFGA